MTDSERKILTEQRNYRAELNEFRKKLKEKIENSNQVFITTHINSDIDAISSAIGISLIANKLKKKSYIIMDDKLETINTGVLTIIDATSNDFERISSLMIDEIKTDNDLLIVTDTNNIELVSCKEYINHFKSIAIIDHHDQNSKTIPSLTKFIKPQTSSTCEIVTTLLEDFRIDYDSDIATYLLAGIYLDTKGLRSETTSGNTFSIVGKLKDKGANTKFSDELQDETFETKLKVNDLIRLTNNYSYRFAICCGKNEEIFSQEMLAKAADELQGFNNDMSCAIGRLNENTVSISSRSNGKINVREIMEIFGGGGSLYRGAAQITDDTTTEEVQKKLVKILKPNFYISEQELKNE